MKKSSKRKDNKNSDREKEKIVKQIKEVSRRLNRNDMWFEVEDNKSLIDSCIYQRGALLNQYKYLLKRAKEEDIKCDPFE